MILRGVNDNGHTRIEVHDSGPGIPEAEREAVFQRFYRAEGGQPQSGFGLGLSIVATIMQLHHGRYSVSSKDGVTCFELFFPGREA